MEAAGEERGEGEGKEAGEALARSKEYWKSERIGGGGAPLSSTPGPSIRKGVRSSAGRSNALLAPREAKGPRETPGAVFPRPPASRLGSSQPAARRVREVRGARTLAFRWGNRYSSDC